MVGICAKFHYNNLRVQRGFTSLHNQPGV